MWATSAGGCARPFLAAQVLGILLFCGLPCLADEPQWVLSPPAEELAADDFFACMAFSPDGKRLAAASKEKIFLWDLETGEFLEQLPAPPENPVEFFSLTFSPDGNHLEATCLNIRNDANGFGHVHQYWVWDLESTDEPPHKHERAAAFGVPLRQSFAYSPNGTKVVTLAVDPSAIIFSNWQPVQLLDVATGQTQVLAIPQQPNPFHIQAVIFSPDGNFVLGVGTGAIVWELRTGRVVRTFGMGGDGGDVFFATECAFTPDGTKLVTSGGYGYSVWNFATGRREQAGGERFVEWGSGFTGGDNVFQNNQSIPISPKKEDYRFGAIAASGSALAWTQGDETIRLWSITQGRELDPFWPDRDRYSDAALSHDGNQFATAVKREQIIQIWAMPHAPADVVPESSDPDVDVEGDFEQPDEDAAEEATEEPAEEAADEAVAGDAEDADNAEAAGEQPGDAAGEDAAEGPADDATEDPDDAAEDPGEDAAEDETADDAAEDESEGTTDDPADAPPATPGRELEYRTWTSSSGQNTVEAALVKAISGTLTLRLRDGREVEVELEQLSEADQQYFDDLRN